MKVDKQSLNMEQMLDSMAIFVVKTMFWILTVSPTVEATLNKTSVLACCSMLMFRSSSVYTSRPSRRLNTCFVVK